MPERSARITTYPPLGYWGPRAIAKWALATKVESLTVDGLASFPRTGPVLIVARHYHHLLDGAIIVDRVPRPVHIVVGLDWTRDRRERRLMEWACRASDFPIVVRPATLGARTDGHPGGYGPGDVFGYTRNALRDASRLLRARRVVAVFPEAYPNVDPTFAQKSDGRAFLPFARGWSAMRDRAERDGSEEIAVVPLGLRYEHGAKWRIVARFGAPLAHPDGPEVEREIRVLSRSDAPDPDEVV